MDKQTPSVPIKALGALTIEVCSKLQTGVTSGVTAMYSARPPFQLLLVNAAIYPERAERILGVSDDPEDYAVTTVLRAKGDIASWPEGSLQQLKIKVTDRFMRHCFAVAIEPGALEASGISVIREAAPGVNVLVETNKSGASLTRLQLAIRKSHLRADRWKTHISAFYVPTPRKEVARDPTAEPRCTPLPTVLGGCMRARCDVKREEMRMCPCGEAYYCSEAHAVDDWYNRHAQMCATNKK